MPSLVESEFLEAQARNGFRPGGYRPPGVLGCEDTRIPRRREMRDLKLFLRRRFSSEQVLENRLLQKKHDRGWGETTNEIPRIRGRLEIIRLVERRAASCRLPAHPFDKL